MFEVGYDSGANIVRISVRGFWKPEDVSALARAVGAALQEARTFSERFDVLVESLEFPVQANDVADLLANILHGGAALSAGHFAVVVGSHLNRLQAERTLVHPRLRVFLAMDEAQGWLASMRGAAGES
jgi:hypothetical protein